MFQFGYPSAPLSGWTKLQSYRGLTGATDERLAEVKSMDKAFNLIHGAGATLNDEKMTDPIPSTAESIQKKCPDINKGVITYFTKVKYFYRIKAINEKNKIDIVTERKRKAEERNQKPKPVKMMRDHTKDGHFSFL